MIYEFPKSEEPIRQGDIFFPLPRASLDLEEISVVNRDENSFELKNWDEVSSKEVTVLVPIEKVWGIVASQDCDTSRSPYISLFQIEPVSVILGEANIPKSEKNWVEWITKKCMANAKWFYLPQESKVGFEQRMIVVFERVIQIPRESLESRRGSHRKARLNHTADEHYRESIAEFFRRYPYNEWYPFDYVEFTKYKEKYPDTEPYPWQANS